MDRRVDAGSANGSQEAPATGKALERLSKGFFGYELEKRQKDLAGTVVRFGFGTAVGVFYGAVAEFSPAIARGDGVPFATGLFAVSDDVEVPAHSFSGPPQGRQMSSHLYALCSHVVYGFALENRRRVVRRVLEPATERRVP